MTDFRKVTDNFSVAPQIDLGDIAAELLALEHETEGLLKRIVSPVKQEVR